MHEGCCTRRKAVRKSIIYSLANMKSTKLENLSERKNSECFAIIDSAIIDGIGEKLKTVNPEDWCCLYRGNIEPWQARVAPYLVSLSEAKKLPEFLTNNPPKNWGVYLFSGEKLQQIKRHLRKFLTVRLPPDSSRCLFRYYDPRVLETFLGNLNETDAKKFFGPITGFGIPLSSEGDYELLSLNEGNPN